MALDPTDPIDPITGLTIEKDSKKDNGIFPEGWTGLQAPLGSTREEVFPGTTSLQPVLLDVGVPLDKLQKEMPRGIPVDVEANYERVLAKGQPGLIQLGNGVVGGIASGVLTAAEDMSYILDFDNHVNVITGEDTWERNWLAELTVAGKEGLGEIMPLYRTNRGDTFDWSDWGFYMESAKGVLDSAVGFGLPGMGMAKVIGAGVNAARMAGYMKFLTKAPVWEQAIVTGTTGLLTNYAEGKIMGMEIHDRIMKDPEFQHLSYEDRFEEANKQSGEFLWENRIFAATDWMTLHGAFKGANYTRGVWDNIKKKSIRDRFTTFNLDNPLVQGGKEYIEEVGQFGFQEDAVYEAKRNFGMDVSQDPENYAKRLGKYIMSDQARYEGMLGFLGGGPQRYLAKGVQRLQHRLSTRTSDRPFGTSFREAQEEKRKDMQSQFAANEKYIKDYIDRIIVSGSLKDEGSVYNMPELAKLVDKKAMYEVFKKNFINGTTEHLETFLRDVAEGNMSEEVAKTFPEEGKELAAEMLEDLLELENQWIKDGGFVNNGEIFESRINKKLMEEFSEITEKYMSEAESTLNKDISAITKMKKYKDISYNIDDLEENKDQKNHADFVKRVKKLESYKEYIKRKDELQFASEAIVAFNDQISEQTTYKSQKDFLEKQESQRKAWEKKVAEDKENVDTDGIIEKGDQVTANGEKGEYVGTTTDKDGNIIHQINIGDVYTEFKDSEVDLKKRESRKTVEENKKEEEHQDNLTVDTKATEEQLDDIANRFIEEVMKGGALEADVFNELEKAIIDNNEKVLADKINAILDPEGKQETPAQQTSEVEAELEKRKQEELDNIGKKGVQITFPQIVTFISPSGTFNIGLESESKISTVEYTGEITEEGTISKLKSKSLEDVEGKVLPKSFHFAVPDTAITLTLTESRLKEAINAKYKELAALEQQTSDVEATTPSERHAMLVNRIKTGEVITGKVYKDHYEGTTYYKFDIKDGLPIAIHSGKEKPNPLKDGTLFLKEPVEGQPNVVMHKGELKFKFEGNPVLYGPILEVHQDGKNVGSLRVSDEYTEAEGNVTAPTYSNGDRVVHNRLGLGTVARFTPNSGKYSVRFDKGELTKAGIPKAQSVSAKDLAPSNIEKPSAPLVSIEGAPIVDIEEVVEEGPTTTSAVSLLEQANLKKAQETTTPPYADNAPPTAPPPTLEEAVQDDIKFEPVSLRLAYKSEGVQTFDEGENVFQENAKKLSRLFEDPDVSLIGIPITFSIDTKFIKGNKYETQVSNKKELSADQAIELPIRGEFVYEGETYMVWLHSPTFESRGIDDAQKTQLGLDKKFIYDALREGKTVTNTIAREGNGFVLNYQVADETQLPSPHEMLSIDPKNLKLAIRTGTGTIVAGYSKDSGVRTEVRVPRSAKLTKENKTPGATYVLTKSANGTTIPLRIISSPLNEEEATLIFGIYLKILEAKGGGKKILVKDEKKILDYILNSSDPRINGINNILDLEGKTVTPSNLGDLLDFLVYEGEGTNKANNPMKRLFISGNQLNYGVHPDGKNRYNKLEPHQFFKGLRDNSNDVIQYLMDNHRRRVLGDYINTKYYNEYLSTSGIIKGVNIPVRPGIIFRSPVISMSTGYNTTSTTKKKAISQSNKIEKKSSLTSAQKEIIADLKSSDPRWNVYSDEDIQRFIDSLGGNLNTVNKLLQEKGRSLEKILDKEIKNLQTTVENELIVEQDDELIRKGGQSYIYLNNKDAERFSHILDKTKEFPKEFKVTKRITKYEKNSKNPLKFSGYNEYVDYYYVKLNNNKKSNLYQVVDKATGEIIVEKARVLHLAQDSKSKIAEQYGVEFKPTKVFSANRSIAFSLYRQKPSKAKYIAQAKKYLYDALKFLNPEETNLRINLDKIENLLDSFPNEMWDYINTTYSPENSTNVNASTSLQNEIKFNLPKLGFLTEIEKIVGFPLQGVSFKNYDRSGGLAKIFNYSENIEGDWGNTITIDSSKMTTRQLHASISYYLKSKDYFKSSSSETNVRKYAEHKGIDYKELNELVFGDIDKALDNISHNTTGNSDTIELAKWRESIREYDWQSAELFSKPYENFQNTVKERITEKFKDKNLSNGISHLEYFFNSGAFNWLNINFNNVSGQYYTADMETRADTGVKTKMGGIINPFEMKVYSKPKAGENFLKEEEVFNRLAAILHEPFHALHALAYGTKEEKELRVAFDNLYRTDFGKELMNEAFGSGYNKNQNVSYDTLYKEFTAFTTQIMLYPKGWINKTDLRSNDIIEFIEKIQSLQDKTYTEIVKTQQKIGTTENTITEEEQIKLSFLEKLYNYLIKALNKVIPSSKKFLQTLPESNLVSKKVIEDVFGTIEEETTKTLKLPENIKKSKEDFLQKMDELQIAINTLMQVDSKLFSSDNITNFFTNNKYNQESSKDLISYLRSVQAISDMEKFLAKREQSSEVEVTSSKNVFTVTPIQAVDKKAKSKAKIATQYIGFAEGIKGSSTALYAKQAGKFANTGEYSSNDTVFVSVGGKRGNETVRKQQQDRTIREAIKALEAGATLITDNAAYVESNSYNEGEKRLAANLKAKDYSYSEITVDGNVLGTWSKSAKPTQQTSITAGKTSGLPSTGINAKRIDIDGDGDVEIFKSNVLNLREAKALFDDIALLFDTTYDSQHKDSDKFGKFRNSPRSLYYGNKPYEYSGAVRPALQITPHIKRKISSIESKLGFTEGYFDMILINEYKAGNKKLGYHTDNEALLNNKGKTNPTVITISVGADRTMKVKDSRTGKVTDIKMNNGSALVMGYNSQINYKHGVEPEANKGMRYSITLRHDAVSAAEKLIQPNEDLKLPPKEDSGEDYFKYSFAKKPVVAKSREEEASLRSYIPANKKAFKVNTVIEGIKRTTNDPLIRKAIKILETTDFKAFYTSELAIFSRSTSEIANMRIDEATGELITEEQASKIPAYYSAKDHQIIFNSDYINVLSIEEINRVLIHELFHPATAIPFAKQSKGLPMTAKEQAFVNNITGIWALYEDLYEEGEDLKYGFKNGAEFISEVMSNSEFREEIYSRKKGFLQKIWDSILKFLGLQTYDQKIVFKAEDLIEKFILESNKFTPETKLELTDYFNNEKEAWMNRDLSQYIPSQADEITDVLTYILISKNKVTDMSNIGDMSIDNYNIKTGNYEGILTTFLNDMRIRSQDNKNPLYNPDITYVYEDLLTTTTFEQIRERVVKNLTQYGIAPVHEKDANTKADGQAYIPHFEINMKDNANSNTKLLIAFNLKVDRIENGKKIYAKGSFLGLPTFNNYTSTWDKLLKNLSDTVSTETKANSLDKMQNIISTMAIYDPSLSAFSEFLSDPNTPLEKKVQFHNAFSLAKINYTNTYFKKNDDGTVSFKIGKADTLSNEDFIKKQWDNDYVEILYTRDDKNDPVFDVDKGLALLGEYQKVRALIANFDDNTSTEDFNKGLQEISDLVGKIGIEMPRDAFNYFITENYADDKIDGAMILIEDVIGKLFVENKTGNTLVGQSIGNMIAGQDNFSEYGHPLTPIEGERRIDSLLKYAEFFKETLVDSTSLGAGGNKLWNYSLYDYVSKSMVEWKEDPTRLIDMAKLPYMQNARELKWLLENPNNIQNSNILQWGTFKEENAGHQGQSYSDMALPDDVADRINRVMKGYFPYPNAADKSRHLNYRGNPNLISANISFDPETNDIQVGPQVVDILMGYLEDELFTMQRAWDSLFSKDAKLRIDESKQVQHYHYDNKGENGAKRLVDENGVPVGNAFTSFYFPSLNYGQPMANALGLYQEGKKGKPFTVTQEFRNNPELRTYLADIAARIIDKEFNQIQNTGILDASGIAPMIDADIYQRYLNDYQGDPELAIRAAIADVSINSMVMSIEMTKLFIGDPRMYKNRGDVKKRTPAGMASGQDLLIMDDAEGNPIVREEYTITALKELVRISEFFTSDLGKKALIRSLKLAKSDMSDKQAEEEADRTISSYKEIDVTDAQGWITLFRAIEIFKGTGKWSTTHSKNEEAIKNGTADYELMKIFFQPIKGVHFELRIDLETGLAVPTYLKYSQAILHPSLTNGTQLDNLRLAMEEQGIDEAIVDEGIKAGVTKMANWFTTPVEIEVTKKKYSRASLDKDSDSMYLFTDNAERTSRPTATSPNITEGWYAEKYKDKTDKPLHYGSLNNPSSAVIRGKNNAYPISTMSAYGTNWTNENFDLFKTTIDDEVAQIKKDLSKFKTLKISNSRIGQGGRFAKLPTETSNPPGKHQAYLDSKLLEIGIDNSDTAPKIVSSFNEDAYSVLSKDQLKFTPVTLKNRFWKLQQDLPHKGMYAALVGSQVKKNIQANINPNKLYGGIKGSVIIDEINRIDITLSNEGLKSVLDKIGYDPLTKTFDDIGNLYDYILKESADQPQDLQNALKRKIAFDAMPQYSKKIQNKLVSLINKKTVKLKQLGGSYIQMSNAGLVGKNLIKGSIKKRIIWLNGAKELRSSRIEEGKEKGEDVVLAGQVLLPHPMIKEIEEMEIDPYSITAEELAKYIDPKVLELIGYRIPNQANSSNDALDIVGFLPEEAGDTIVVYKEITTKTGSDFDIDKMYVIAPNYFTNKKTKKIEYINYLTDENSSVEERAAVYAKNSREARDISKKFREKINALYKKKQKSISAFKGVKTKSDASIISSTKELQEQLEDQRDELKLQRKILNLQKKALKKEINIEKNNGEEDVVDLKNQKDAVIAEIISINPKVEEISKEIAKIKSPDNVKKLTDTARAEVNIRKSTRIEGIEKEIKDIEEERDSAISNIVDLEEFKTLPIELQNTVAAVQNRRIELYRKVLLAPSKFAEVMSPLDFDGIKDDIAQLVPAPHQGDLEFFTLMSNIMDKHNFNGGKFGVGLTANQLVDDAISQIAEISLNEKFGNLGNVTSSGTMDLSKQYDDNGRLISFIMSAYLNAYVDIAKDSYITRGNHNSLTANSVFMLLRAGVNFEWVNAFITQPIIVDYIKYSMNTEGRTSDEYSLGAINYITEKYIGAGLTKDSLPEALNLEEFALEDLRHTANPNNKKFKGKKVDQIDVFSTFLKIKDNAKALADSILVSKADTVGAGKNLMEAYIIANGIQKVRSENIVNNFDTKFEGRALGTFTNNSVRLIQEMLRPLFMTSSTGVMETIDAISMQVTGGPILNNELGDLLQEELYAGIMSKAFQLTDENIFALIYGEENGKNSVANLLKDIKNNPKYDDNLFTNFLSYETRHAPNPSIIGINNTKELPVANQDKITRSWEDNFYGDDPILRRFAGNAVYMAYLTSGFRNNLRSFTKLIPYSVLSHPKFQFDAILNNFHNELKIDPSAISTLVPQVFKHNATNEKLVPKVAKKDMIKVPKLQTSDIFAISAINTRYVKSLDNNMEPIFTPFIFKEEVIQDPNILAQMGSTKNKEIFQSLFEYVGNTIVSTPNEQDSGAITYSQNKVGIYRKTNMLGYNNRGRRIFEYNLEKDGEQSIFQINNLNLTNNTIKAMDNFMDNYNVTLPGSSMYKASFATLKTLYINDETITNKDVLERMKICGGGGKI